MRSRVTVAVDHATNEGEIFVFSFRLCEFGGEQTLIVEIVLLRDQAVSEVSPTVPDGVSSRIIMTGLLASRRPE